MPRLKGSVGNPHEGVSRIGVLLVNHGSPDGTDVKSVRRYLRTFLSDPRMIELPRLLWLVILHGIILRVRPRRTARAYKKIWTQEGSPMQVISDNLLGQVQQRLQRDWGAQVVAANGNLYGNPSIAGGLEKLREAGAQRIVVVPLYPQYTSVTVGSVFDQVTTELQRWRWVPELRFISGYHDEPRYLHALADSVRSFWKQYGRGSKLLISYHSLPVAYVEAGDPYFCVCSKTSRKLAALLGLADDEWEMTFQSKFVGGKWLQPDLRSRIFALGDAGNARLDVICPGFAVDNLETIEEVVGEYVPEFAASAGADAHRELRFIPCLNDTAPHVEVIASLVKANLSGWEQALRPVAAVPNANARLRSG